MWPGAAFQQSAWQQLLAPLPLSQPFPYHMPAPMQMPCMPYGVPLQQHQQVPTPAYIFQAPTPMQMAPAQQMAVQDILTTEAKKKPSTCVKATKQQRYAELATALKAPSAKKGEKERQ
jgi:hypothetical protein